MLKRKVRFRVVLGRTLYKFMKILSTYVIVVIH